MTDPAVRRVVLDMSNVTCADSSLLNLLHHRPQRTPRPGRPFAEPTGVHLLEMTGAHTVLTVTDSHASAREVPLD